MSRGKNKAPAPIADTTDAVRPADPSPVPVAAPPIADTTDAPRAPAPMQTANIIRCPACRGREVHCEGLRDGKVRYYRCLRCVTDDDWTRWKVPLLDPMAPT